MAEIDGIRRTDSGNVRKDDAMGWLDRRRPPTDEEMLDAIVPQRYGSTGKTFHQPISDVRIKGDAAFVERVAGLFRSWLQVENATTRLDIKLRKVKNEQTGADTDTWALYLRAVERGHGRQPRTLDAIPDDAHDILWPPDTRRPSGR